MTAHAPIADPVQLGTVLGVWAHPDDETYGSAGLMACLVRAGRRVVCVNATRGEAGSLDELRWPAARMSQVREAELASALAVLGVTEHHWLDYVDGTCDRVPFDEGVAKVEAIVRDVAPDSVLTFGPDGMTGHADHKAVSAWTTEAFQRAAKPGARLYYFTYTPEWLQRFGALFAAFDVFPPGTPPLTPRGELGIEYPLPADLLALKWQAIRAHVSQTEDMLAAIDNSALLDSESVEMFRLAAVR